MLAYNKVCVRLAIGELSGEKCVTGMNTAEAGVYFRFGYHGESKCGRRENHSVKTSMLADAPVNMTSRTVPLPPRGDSQQPLMLT